MKNILWNIYIYLYPLLFKFVYRHARLLSLLKKFRQKISPDDTVSFSTERPHPLSLAADVTDIEPNKV